MSISDRLDEIQARAAAATGGPWEAYEDVRVPGISHIKVPGSMHSTAWPENAEFIAHARTDVPELVAALRAVLELHEAVQVYQLRDEFGGFATNGDGERILIATLCRECSSDEAIESVEDQEWDEGWAPEVSHPCQTYRTVTAALGEGS